MFTIFVTTCFIFGVFDSQWVILFGMLADIFMVAILLDYKSKVKEIENR